MFVTAGNFNIPPYDIPNLLNVPNTFGPYVDQEEEERLRKLLGGLLYDAFIAGLAEDPVPARWADLRDGVDYTYLGKKYRWRGMVDLLQPYIWSRWTRDISEQNSGAGMIKPNTENSVQISPARRIVQAYNAFSTIAGNECQLCDTIYGYLYSSGDKYADVVASEYSSIQAYLSCVFECPGEMNVFNI